VKLVRKRIITGACLAVLCIAAIVYGSVPYVSLMIALAVLAFYEFARLNALTWREPTVLCGFLGVFALVFPWEIMRTQPFSQLSFVWLVMFLFMVFTVMTKNKTHIDRIALPFIGVVYIGVGFHFMTVTRLMPDGMYWTLLLFGCIWMTDTGAYFAGRFFGRTLLWPSISPNKTVEGAIGGCVASIVVAMLFVVFYPKLMWWQAVSLGFTIAVVGQMGDFIQSAYKRIRHIKDTGALFPGHGGVLDRTDSWMIVFPFVHLFGWWF
jgi:phosphatidate cytidylyltransferase